MAKWRILLAGEQPVHVEVADDRNLAAEFAAFHARSTRRWWAFWKKDPSPYWTITDDVVIHRDAVASIQERPDKPSAKRSIGFGGTDVQVR